VRVLAAVRARLGPGLRRKVESADLVQEVMLDAVRRLPGFEFKTEGAFLHYVNCVVASKIRDEADRWLAQKRDAAREQPAAPGTSGSIPDWTEPNDGGAATPSQVVLKREDLELLEQALDRLAEESADARDLVVAVKLEGRTYAEIAETSGQTPDAVRMRTNRALKSLARIFQQIEREPPGDLGKR
jgi:RNA polymerase sigma factor (sigma-70 family)